MSSLSAPVTADSDRQDATEIFVAQRQRLLGIARRILHNPNEAEDVVQDVWVRWQRTDHQDVRHPSAFLATTTTRVAINVLQAARTRHETAVTPWLAELANRIVDPQVEPQGAVERVESVELAMGVLLERLTPAERAAYLLRKGFDYPYLTIAGLLQLTDANARQLVSRAQRRLASTPRQRVSAEAHRRLVRAFLSAAQGGDLPTLERVLVADTARTPWSRSIAQPRAIAASAA